MNTAQYLCFVFLEYLSMSDRRSFVMESIVCLTLYFCMRIWLDDLYLWLRNNHIFVCSFYCIFPSVISTSVYFLKHDNYLSIECLEKSRIASEIISIKHLFFRPLNFVLSSNKSIGKICQKHHLIDITKTRLHTWIVQIT